ncbi:LysM peptidoglycan-binding domain-containing protein [Leifsonia sp. SIMBA_070]|uniref:LysM peptidoglycan-binding domain-containing protein n=1 Tax=Leifsonia sp. SIMBA_070 TaxID=3085810 RepID=UPI003978AF88
MLRRLAATALAGVLLLAATGCTPTFKTPIMRHVVTHAATPTPAASLPPTAAPTPVATAVGCHGWGFWARDYYSEAQQPVDCGPIEYATGTAKLDDKGVPVSYVVAPGDIWEFIAKRFDVGTAYLTAINAVRRDPASIVYVGDTVNLDPATITTVGDQNGVVFHHDDRLPDPHVPQH